MCKLHGVRLIKGIKIFESMLKTKIYRSISNKTAKSISLNINSISLLLLLTERTAHYFKVKVEFSPVSIYIYIYFDVFICV